MEKDSEIRALKERMDRMGDAIMLQQNDMMELNSSMKSIIDDHMWYVKKFGLSEPTLKRIEESLVQIKALPDSKYIPDSD